MSAAGPVITQEQWDALPDASPERLAKLGFNSVTNLEDATAKIYKKVSRARQGGKLLCDKLPPRTNRDRPSRRVEGEQLAGKKARAARVLAEALSIPRVALLLARGFTHSDVRVLFVVLRRAAENGGVCDWHVDKIACMAGVHRNTVTAALKRLHLAAHLAVTWRPRSGRKHLTNIVRPGLSDTAEDVWKRMTMRRVAVAECGSKVQRDEPIRATTTTDAGSTGSTRACPRSEAPCHPPWLDAESLSIDSIARWGETDGASDLDPEYLVPADGPLTALQAQLRRSVALMAAKRASTASELEIQRAGHA